MVELMRGHLQGARESGMSEKCRQQLTSASVRLGCISAECTKIQATIAASDRKAMGQLMELPAEKLELHPANLAAEPQEELWRPIEREGEEVISGHLRARMLASLHAAGDHTLDEEEEKR